MSEQSNLFGGPPAVGRRVVSRPISDRGARIGQRWGAWEGSGRAVSQPRAMRHGCVVVRRITDDRGREWRVRQLWSAACYGVLFQCAVPGIRAEARAVRATLDSLTDEELVTALMPADD